jgi:hypothetical protein
MNKNGRPPKPPATKYIKKSYTLSPEALAILDAASKALKMSKSAVIDDMVRHGGRWVGWRQGELYER